MGNTDPLAPFRLLAKRGWNWDLHAFAAHFDKLPSDVWAKEKFLLFRQLVEAANGLGDQTLGKLIDDPRTKTLTADEKAAYVSSGYSTCPYCKSTSIGGDSIEVDGNTASQEVSCGNCDRNWADVYTLTAIVEGS